MKKRCCIIVAMVLSVVSIAWATTPKYIFYFIGDGMGMGHIQALRTYYKTVGDAEGAVHFYDYPVASFISTYSYNSDVTDSAAAGTALACGSKTRNGMVGMSADTVALTSIAKQMKAAGRGVALISSVCIDDATPAAFMASCASRGDYYEIARQGAASGFDFLAGAYFRDPYGVKAHTPGNLLAEYEAAGYTVVRGKNGYDNATNASRILWLDADTVTENRIGYAVDGINGDVTLPQMVECGIDFLYNNHRKGFFMMAEGGAIDHMAHANDPSGVLREVQEFDNAVRKAYEFYLQHKHETLIIITADHETGGLGMGVNGIYELAMHNLPYAKMSKGEFGEALAQLLKKLGKSASWSDVRDFMGENLGLGSKIAMTAGEEGRLMIAFQNMLDNRGKDVKTLYASFNELTNEIFKVYSDKYRMGWTTGGHTGAPVPLFVIGAGSDSFEGQGWLDNTDIPRIIGEVSRVVRK